MIDLEHISETAPLRLSTAARLAFPDGSMSASGLRKEAAKGRLTIERIAGKDFVTLAAIQSMRNLCQIRRRAPRLWLRPARGRENATWIIRDGDKQIRTRCSPDDRAAAERSLGDYISDKYKPARQRDRDPAFVPIADVLNIYMTDAAPKVASPRELGQRVVALLEFFGGRKLGEISGALCRAYAERRSSQSMARRELEDLRAAINHHRREGLCNAIVEVVLPPKAPSRQRWLTRSEAARMIWAAWRYPELQKGKETDRRSRRHVARFMLVALYTGTRSSAICGAAIRPAIGRGHVDLESGLFYRRAPGARETKKRQPTIRLPDRLLAHMRRWERLGLARTSVVEFGGGPVKSVRKAFAKGRRGSRA